MARTLEQFLEILDSDLSWRKRELSNMLAAIDAAKADRLAISTFLRAGVVLLYAHWEGFLKKALSEYVEYVSYQSPNHDSLKDGFLTLCWKKQMKWGDLPATNQRLGLLTSFFRSRETNRMVFLDPKVIDTQSNLSFPVAEDLLWSVDVESDWLAPKAKLIDKSLLGRRNHIAHGQVLKIELEGYRELHDQTIGILNELLNRIENCAVTKAYIRAT
jgi:hypothetical protein